jgi:hypothetical protein
VTLGLIWGLLGFEGGVSFFSFFPVLAGVSFMYVTKVLSIDDEDFGRGKVRNLCRCWCWACLSVVGQDCLAYGLVLVSLLAAALQGLFRERRSLLCR